MTWTVACFCGATYSVPPIECPRCAAALPEMAGPPLARVGAPAASAHNPASIADSRRGMR